jgi:hypothetical protein
MLPMAIPSPFFDVAFVLVLLSWRAHVLPVSLGHQAHVSQTSCGKLVVPCLGGAGQQ